MVDLDLIGKGGEDVTAKNVTKLAVDGGKVNYIPGTEVLNEHWSK